LALPGWVRFFRVSRLDEPDKSIRDKTVHASRLKAKKGIGSIEIV
jgi:hypothetical protein